MRVPDELCVRVAVLVLVWTAVAVPTVVAEAVLLAVPMGLGVADGVRDGRGDGVPVHDPVLVAVPEGTPDPVLVGVKGAVRLRLGLLL